MNLESHDNAIEIYQELLSKNKIIDLADILIGATAITHEIPLATLNVKHFERIEQLKILKKEG
jgi:predicted nucleic acid-binding protein